MSHRVCSKCLVERILNDKSSDSELNRRASPRFQFEVDIEIEWRSKSIWGRVGNISREGMFIQLDEAMEPGATFSGNLSLNIPLRVIGLVRRTVPQYGHGQRELRRAARRMPALANCSWTADAAARW